MDLNILHCSWKYSFFTGFIKEPMFFSCNYLGAPILRQKIGIFVYVDVGTHGCASLREKILAKTGAKRALFD